MSIRCLAKRAIEECNDIELLDLVYRILVFDMTEGRAEALTFSIKHIIHSIIKMFFI